LTIPRREGECCQLFNSDNTFVWQRSTGEWHRLRVLRARARGQRCLRGERKADPPGIGKITGTISMGLALSPDYRTGSVEEIVH
jgi:hypothetical protein